jgi:hypothetical protein
MADAAADGEDQPPSTGMGEEENATPAEVSAAAMFASMVPPVSVMGSIEAKIHMETSALDAFIVQLLEGLRKLASVSIRKFTAESVHIPHGGC